MRRVIIFASFNNQRNAILKYPIFFENSIYRYSFKNALISALMTIWDVKINENQINRLKHVVFFYLKHKNKSLRKTKT